MRYFINENDTRILQKKRGDIFMNKRLSIFMALIMLLCMTTSTVLADSTVVTDAFDEFVTENFENGEVGSLTIQNAGGGEAPAAVAGKGYNGSYGAALDYSKCTIYVAGFRVAQKQAFANKEYGLSLKIKYPADVTPTANMSFNIYNDANRGMSYVNLKYTALEDGWYLAEGKGTYPGNDTTNLIVDIRINEQFLSDGEDDPIYVDDIVLTPVEKRVGHGEPSVFEWNAGDGKTKLTYGTNGWNGAKIEEQADGRLKIHSTAQNNGIDVSIVKGLFPVTEGNMYRIEMIGEVTGTLATNIFMPTNGKVAKSELLTDGKYRIVNEFIADSTFAHFLQSNGTNARLFCGFGTSAGTDFYMETLRITDYGKIWNNTDIATYAYTIDTNNEYAYGLVDKQIVTQEATDDTEAVVETRVVVQQFNLDGTPTDKYFDIKTIEEGNEFATAPTGNYHLKLMAENGKVIARTKYYKKITTVDNGDGTTTESASWVANPVSVCLMDFNSEEAQGYVYNVGTSGAGNAVYLKNGFLFVAMGTVIMAYKTDMANLGQLSYLRTHTNNPHEIYVDWDGVNPGRIISVSGSNYGDAFISSSYPAVVGVLEFGIDNINRPKFDSDITTYKGTDLTAAITEAVGVTSNAGFMPVQVYLEGNKIYVVSTSYGAVCKNDYIWVFDLASDNSVTINKKIALSDVDSSLSGRVTGIAPNGQYFTLFTSDGRRIEDSAVPSASYICTVDKDTFKRVDEYANYPISSRASSIGWTDKYIYGSYNFYNTSNSTQMAKGAVYFDKSAEKVTPVITTDSIVGGKATFTIPTVSETNIAYYRILATSDGIGYNVIDSGVTSAESISVKLTEELAGCKLKLELAYADKLSSYGSAETADRVFMLRTALAENFADCTIPSVVVKGDIPANYNKVLKLILAFYKTNENGASELIDSRVYDYNPQTGAITGEAMTIPAGADTVSAFLWDSLEEMTPCSPKASVSKTVEE